MSEARYVILVHGELDRPVRLQEQSWEWTLNYLREMRKAHGLTTLRNLLFLPDAVERVR